MYIDSTQRSIEVFSDASATTAEPEYVVSWADISTVEFTPGTATGLLDGTTPVLAIPAPTAGLQRHVQLINVYNADTVDHTITVQYKDDAEVVILGEFSLAVGHTLTYTPDNGWVIWGQTGPQGPAGAPGPKGDPGGAASFTTLDDTPSTYAGEGGKVVAVKGDESGLEFITGGGGGGGLGGILEIDVSAGNQVVSSGDFASNSIFHITDPTFMATGREVTFPAEVKDLLVVYNATFSSVDIAFTYDTGTGPFTVIQTLPYAASLICSHDPEYNTPIYSRFRPGEASLQQQFFSGVPTANQVVAKFLVPNTAYDMAPTYAQLFDVGCRVHSGLTPTGSSTFDVLVNGVSSGSVTFTASTQEATVSLSSGFVAMGPGDVLEIVAPNAPDSTTGDITVALQFLGAF